MPEELRGLVLRHGDTDLNDLDLLKGLLDPPLSDDGLSQITKAAKFLKKYPVQRILSSPLLRAMESAEIASGMLGGIHVEQCRSLFPWAVGTDFMGKPKQDSGLEYYIEHCDEEPANGESLDSVIERVKDFFEEKLSIPELTLYATHNSVIVTLNDLIQGTSGSHPETGDVVGPGGVCAIYDTGDPENPWRIEPIFGQVEDAGYTAS